MRVLIAGAGIAGLATALSLHAAGIEARLVDSAAGLKPLGVVLARELARAAAPEEGLRAYESARLSEVNAIVLATRTMPVDQVLDMVSARAPGGFDRIEDVLAPAELAALRDAYRATSLPGVAALNSRPPLG